MVPLDPTWEATTLVIEKCKYMSSKMVPLFLIFNNADETGPPHIIMFKSGDDLRQDILTLQMLRIMDQIWLNDGVDLCMKPYKCIATGINASGDGVGMIEIVLNSDTTSSIQQNYGSTAFGAFSNKTLDRFIKDHNTESKQLDKALENFAASCAGYCVATCVLGIGDRHNGNIMVTKDGHLFHIDFGHFLGNFKSKMGVNRERSTFVFTIEMAFCIARTTTNMRKSIQYKKFLKLCKLAFLALRKNAQTLESLFMLMTSAGMPELMKESDINYLREMLLLDMNEKKAEQNLYEQIDSSVKDTFRRFDNWIHNLKHGK